MHISFSKMKSMYLWRCYNKIYRCKAKRVDIHFIEGLMMYKDKWLFGNDLLLLKHFEGAYFILMILSILLSIKIKWSLYLLSHTSFDLCQFFELWIFAMKNTFCNKMWKRLIFLKFEKIQRPHCNFGRLVLKLFI